jgi:hypothetical protein
MVNMILMVLFSIKMVCVASVCVTKSSGTLQASGYSSCSDLSSARNSFALYIDKGLAPGGRVAYQSTRGFSTLSQCAQYCRNIGSCNYFDYNCQTGNCDTFEFNPSGSGSGTGSDRLFSQNGHISAYHSAKK